MISARSLVLVLALASAPLMAQETTPLEKELIVPKPLLIVPPDYPPKALAEGRTAEIRIRGTITSEGVLESPVFANSPAEEGFVQAIRAVLKMWRFIPGINSESCSAVPLGADVHVWFEITDGKPAIFVSMPAAAASKTTREGTSDPNRKIPWERRPKAAYPRSAFRAGVEGMAIVLLRVARSGEISEVNVLASSPASEFGDEAHRATRRAKYEALDPNVWAKAPICAMLTYKFCIGPGAEFPSNQCAAAR